MATVTMKLAALTITPTMNDTMNEPPSTSTPPLVGIIPPPPPTSEAMPPSTTVVMMRISIAISDCATLSLNLAQPQPIASGALKPSADPPGAGGGGGGAGGGVSSAGGWTDP